jgi:Protein of unknown function (DUF2934)
MATKKTSSKSTTTAAVKSPRKKLAAEKPKSTGRKTRASGKSSPKLAAGFIVDQAPAPEIMIPQDQIAMRAYFIAERRHQMGWHGDSHSDWVEAEAQLKAESINKPFKKR